MRRRQIVHQLFHTAVLRVLSTGARAVTFVLVVRLLTPRDYGWYALITTTLYIATLVSSLNFPSYFIRALPGRQEATQYGIFRGLTGPVLIANGLVAILCATAGRYFLPGEHAHVAELAALIYFFEIAGGQVENFFLGCKKIQNANWIMGLRTLSMALFVGGLVFVGWQTLEAILGAMLAAEVLALLVGLSWLSWSALRVAKAPTGLWSEALLYSLPLLGSGLAFMGMKFGDKYLVAHYLGLVAVARYSFAYAMVNLAYGLTVLVSNTVLVPHIMGAENEDDVASRNRHIVRATKLAVYGLLAAAVAYAVIPSGFWALFSGHRDYLGVKGLALALTVASLMSVLGNPAHFILLAKKKTGILALIDVGGVCSIAGLNVLLLPSFGLYGATLSAAISFAATSALKHLYVWQQKIFNPRDLLNWADEKEALSRLAALGTLD